MSLDLTLRAETPATLAYALKRPLMQHLGVRFPQDENGAEILNPDDWKASEMLGPDIHYHYIRQNGLVVVRGTHDAAGGELTPPDLDPYCWLLLRVIRGAAEADWENNSDPEPDRWKKSRMTRLLRETGTAVTPLGVQAWQHSFGQSAPKPVRGKVIQIMRGSELAALQIFPQFAGGGIY